MLFALCFAIFRSATLGLMLASVLLPFALLALGQPAAAVVTVALLAALIVLVHRHNIRARLQRPRDA